MEQFFRKLQRISGSFFVSLPKSWVKNFNMTKNSIIRMEIREDGSLFLYPKLKQEVAKDELILNSSNYVARDIVKNCLSGIETIVVISDVEIEPEIKKQINWFVAGLPNTEIIEDQKQRIVIQNFGYKKIPTKKLIQRLLYIICDMFEYLREYQHEQLKNSFNQLKRFYFILVTHIRTYLRTGVYISEDTTFSPLEAMDYRMFCEKIEEIGVILRDIQISNKIRDFLTITENYFKDTMDAYLKKDFEKAHLVWFKKEELTEKASELMKSLNFAEKEQIKDLIRIIEKCKDMAAFI